MYNVVLPSPTRNTRELKNTSVGPPAFIVVDPPQQQRPRPQRLLGRQPRSLHLSFPFPSVQLLPLEKVQTPQGDSSVSEESLGNGGDHVIGGDFGENGYRRLRMRCLRML